MNIPFVRFWSTTQRDQTVSLTGADVLLRHHVRLVGTGTQTVVLAHGFGSDQTAWRHLERAFLPHYRLVLFNMVGATSANIDHYSPHRYKSLHSYAADLLELLSALDLQQVIYVGHSMSAMIGVLAALSQPARFAKLILLNASPHYLNDGSYRGGFEPSDIEGLYAAMAANYHTWASGYASQAMGNGDRPELSAEFTATLSAIRPDVAVAVARLIFQSDHRADLAQLTIPALVVQSNQDVAVPLAVGQYLAHHIPRAELVVIAAEGHLPHVSAPAEVIRVIHRYLS